MKSEPSPEFAAIRGRSLLGLLILSLLAVGVGVEFVVPERFTVEQGPLADAVSSVALYVLLAGLLSVACLRAKVLNQVSLGPKPSRRDMIDYILLGIPLVGIALLGLYVLYLPLSYVYPNFVDFVLLDFPPLIVWRNDLNSLLANIINVMLLVVIAPIVEEVLFRGFLLNRWWKKYGVRKAVIYSSIAFGILHVDFIGGIVFGIVLSLIYVKTKSLIGPIVAHASNNAVLALWLVTEGVVTGDISAATLDEFRAFWWLAILGAAVGVPWLVWFCRRLFRPGIDAASQTGRV